MTDLAQLLQVREVEGIEALAETLLAEFGAHVSAIWLFGSKSRGESFPDSDIDLLVIIQQLTPQLRWRIREIAADCSLEYDVLLNTHILAEQEWEKHINQRSTLWREIQQDGIPIAAEIVGIPAEYDGRTSVHPSGHYHRYSIAE